MLDVWNRIKQTGSGWYWIAPRLRAGDVFHLCSFAAAFKEVHGEAPIFLVVSSQHQANMAAVFDDHIARVLVEPSMSSDDWKALSLREDLPRFAMNSPLLLDPWTNREIEPGPIEFLGENGVLWTQLYKHLLRVPLIAEPTAPAVRPDRVEQARALCEAVGMRPGRSVLLFPYAQTYSADTREHFTKLTETVSGEYDVYTSVAGDEAAIPGTTPLFIPFALLQEVAEYAGWAVVLRSGIADILASARCRKSIVYRDLDAVQGWSLLQLDLARDASEFAFPFFMKSPELFVSTLLGAPMARDAVFRARGLAERVEGRHVSLDQLGSVVPEPGETLVVRDIPYRAHPRRDTTDRLRRLIELAGRDRRLFASRDSVLLDHRQGSYPFWEEIDTEMLLHGRYEAAGYWHTIALSDRPLEPCLPLTSLFDDYLDLADPGAADARARSSTMTTPFGHKGVTLISGWFPAEGWGAWGRGPHSRIRLVLQHAPTNGFVLTLGLNLVMSERCPEVTFTVVVNGVSATKHLATLDGRRDFETFVPSTVVRSRIFDIAVRFEGLMSPQEQGLSGDPRYLGMGLRTLKVEPPRPLRDQGASI